MNRIDLPHLVWSLESLACAGQVVNRITVEETVAANARVALDRMPRIALSASRRARLSQPDPMDSGATLGSVNFCTAGRKSRNRSRKKR